MMSHPGLTPLMWARERRAAVLRQRLLSGAWLLLGAVLVAAVSFWAGSVWG